jgi:putative (di)nucleoside polyphosphate hydrolase
MMLLNAKGRIFVGKRIDQSVEAWQMPQGGIDEGEDPRVAALRELKEEIGTSNAQIIREHPDWLTYDLPPHLVGFALQGRYRGQRQKWFALRFKGTESEIHLDTPHPEFAAWKWLDIAELPRVIVPFKRPTYAAVIAEFKDLARPG